MIWLLSIKQMAYRLRCASSWEWFTL